MDDGRFVLVFHAEPDDGVRFFAVKIVALASPYEGLSSSITAILFYCAIDLDGAFPYFDPGSPVGADKYGGEH